MVDYLTKFKKHSDYDAVKSTLRYPNVSYCVQEDEVHYNFNPCLEYDYIEIAGIKWATKNVGACTETDCGNYYQYGKGANTYQVTIGQSDYSGTEDPLAATADTATQVWGDGWRMPTKAELQSLVANTNYTWETNFNGSGVNGAKFTDKTDSSKYIFIPAAGTYSGYNSSLDLAGEGEDGNIWSSTPYTYDSSAYNLGFYDEGVNVSLTFRDCGCSIRPVLDSGQQLIEEK